MEQEPTKTWTVNAFNHQTGEFVEAINRSWDHRAEVTPDMFVTQAPPINVRPTKRTRPEGDFEIYMFYGDTHHPFQNRQAMALANIAVREVFPDHVTYIGDDNDMALFSTFESRQEWLGSTQQGIDQFSEQLAQTRADIGSDGRITVHKGNHDYRMERELRKYNGELLGLRRAGEDLGALTMEYLLRCGELGVEYIGDRHGEKWYSDNLKSYHGDVTNSTGLAVAKEIKGETVNFVHGHTHNAGIMYKTFKDGKEEKTIFGMEVGTFADPNLIPSGKYSTDERGNVSRQSHNWQKGLGMVAMGEGVVIPQFIPITEEGILINGKWYKS